MIESFLTVGRQIITLYLLMAVGYVLGKLKLIDDHGAASMSTLVMYIVSPCMLLVAFQRPIEQDTLHNFYVVVAVSLLLHVAFIVLSRLMIHDTDRHRRNLLLFAGCELWMVAGYFGFECVLYGPAAALGSLVPNLLQGVVGTALGLTITPVLERLKGRMGL